jgi:CheY-like chemotaxis protein
VTHTGPSILVVDDDPAIRELIGRLLTAHGYQVVRAANGEEALDHMRERRPCVVVLDLQMPVVDGWEFRRRQLADPELADVPVICITGYYDPTDLFRQTGVQCLSKPIALSGLLQAVQRACLNSMVTADRSSG